MDRIPFGIRQLDTIVQGGAPSGSVVLLAGEAGAGSREFVHTSALLNGLGVAGDELFDLYYGDLAADARHPAEVHYLSFTDGERDLGSEMRLEMDPEIVDEGYPTVEFHDLSDLYFHVSPVPRDWYADRAQDITELRKHREREDLMAALGNRLDEIPSKSLIVIDSLTDLVSRLGTELEWSDVTYFVRGIQKAAHEWGGLVLLHLNHESISDRRFSQLADAVDGTMRFEWETGGSTRARTLAVKQFRGVLSRIEAENIVTFETEIGEAGFDISDVRKIR